MESKQQHHLTSHPHRRENFSVKYLWIVSAMLFLLGTFVLNRFLNFFISPDETANAFFAHVFLQTGSFRVFHEMNAIYGGILHPRSMVTDGSYLLPGGFFGLPFLYASLMRLFGAWSLTFITPVLVLCASLAWNQILQKWFSKRVAFIASLLFLFHPAVWYYSARGLMPNMLFVCCLIFSVYFFLKQYSNKRLLFFFIPSRYHSITFFFSGLFLGLALFVRLSEAYWVLPLFLFLAYTEYKSIRATQIVLTVFGFLIPIFGLLFLNLMTYGNPFTFGYSFVSSSSHVIAQANTSVSEEKLSWLFPFGFHPRAIFWHTWDYMVMLFWWLTVPAVCAFPLLYQNKKQRAYIWVSGLIVFWLCVWYGSWKLADNPDPTKITIANSYIRYWLPAFVLSTPLIATTLDWMTKHLSPKRLSLFVFGTCGLILFVLNMQIVFLNGPDALSRVVQTLEQSEQIRSSVLSIVPKQGVIITERSDKLFFPARSVIVPLRSEQTFANLPNFVNHVPVYYYGITLPQTDLDFLNTQTLLPMNLRMDFIQNFGIESLYKINKEGVHKE